MDFELIPSYSIGEYSGNGSSVQVLAWKAGELFNHMYENNVAVVAFPAQCHGEREWWLVRVRLAAATRRSHLRMDWVRTKLLSLNVVTADGQFVERQTLSTTSGNLFCALVASGGGKQ